MVLERLRSTDHGERERERSTQGIEQEKYFPQTIDWEEREGLIITSFYKSEVLGVHTITRVKVGEHSSAPVEKENRDLGMENVL